MIGFRVTVPASTANLGPGFDTFGLALGRYEIVELRALDDGLLVEPVDAGAGDVSDVPTGEEHLVVRALRRACRHLDVRPPGLYLRCHHAIPHARGLGSSAAAAVAGIAAGYALADKDLDGAALELAAELEGHADNAAASLLGGLVLAWQDGGESCGGTRWQAERLEPHPTVRPVVAVADARSSTAQARGLLPERVPHADAAFTAGRAALGLHALTTDPRLLLAGTEDRLHQQYREAAYPETIRLVRDLRARGVAATVSGGGPSVLALTTDGELPEGADLSGFTTAELPIDRTGVRIARL
ncbi:homoserine kinase [Haloechinothrix sp. LS1_15]|uniref:homoserine kinase n=1 Tax=Haloechinothrix sp. LS1_15 TaxID=2652248 RepID=UPI0029464298|nr:homoserine kinase [Haloechinothrix sp. LS1_15]MDV6011774.1 homoserine kinase [Haloechinothrix sp. LS1_15]